MKIGLTREELGSRNNDSLIKYIGILQSELACIYEKQFPRQESEDKKALDFSCSTTLKCNV